MTFVAVNKILFDCTITYDVEWACWHLDLNPYGEDYPRCSMLGKMVINRKLKRPSDDKALGHFHKIRMYRINNRKDG